MARSGVASFQKQRHVITRATAGQPCQMQYTEKRKNSLMAGLE